MRLFICAKPRFGIIGALRIGYSAVGVDAPYKVQLYRRRPVVFNLAGAQAGARAHHETEQRPARRVDDFFQAELSRIRLVHRRHHVIGYAGELILAAIMVLYDPGRGWRFRVNDMIIRNLSTGAGDFTGMMIESQMNAFHIGKIGGDIGIGNQDGTVLHILWMDEFNVVNDIEFFQQHSADQPVEITTGNQSKHIVAHNIHTLFYASPPPYKGVGLNVRIILTIHSAK